MILFVDYVNNSLKNSNYKRNRTMKKLIIISIVTIIGSIGLMAQKGINYDSFTDARDGKAYKTIKIGDQIWMAENLAFKASVACLALDNNEKNVDKYGYLYNWETSNNVCPEDWHLPTDEEWTVLTTYLGADADKKLKDTGGWNGNGNGNNESGFSALPGGYAPAENIFEYTGYYGYWWSSSERDNLYAWYSLMGYNHKVVTRDNANKRMFYSVRCIKD